MSITTLSPPNITWGVIGFRFGRLTTQPAVSAVAVMSYSTSTLSLVAPITWTCHLPARSAGFSTGGGGGAGATAAVVSAAGVASFLAHPASTATQQNSTIRRI